MDKANFFKDDPELKRQLTELDGVSSKAGFSNWKNSFLKVVQTFLDQEGTLKAEAAYQDFTKNIGAMEKAKAKLQACLDNGSLSKEKCSVKARRCLAELQAALAKVSATLQELLPGNKAAKVGYSNYHMGAMLISEGFQSYGSLSDCDTTLLAMKEEALQYVADKQLLAEIDNYHDKLKMFCAIMADLGIFQIATKAQEIAKLDEEDPVEVEQVKLIPTAAPVTAAATEPTAPSTTTEPTREEPPPQPEQTEAAPVVVAAESPAPAPEAPPPPPAARAPATAAPPRTIETAAEVKEEKEEETLQPQTITITATHSAPKKAKDDAPKKKVRKKPSKTPKGDQPDDLPRTVKPKSPPRIPGNGGGPRGRGVGRTLSKEEAKEVRVPSKGRPTKKKPAAPPPKGKPPRKEEDEPEEEEPEEDDNEDDNEEEEDDKKEKPKKQQPKKAPAVAKKTGPASEKPAGKQAPSAAAGAKKAQPAKAAPVAVKDPAAGKVPITVHQTDGTKIKMMVDLRKDKLGDLKKQLEKKTGMPVEQQRISIKYLGKELELDDATLAFYAVKPESDLDLDPKWITISIKKEDGKCHSFKRIQSAVYTVNNIKGKIERELGLSADRQLLKFKGQKLDDGRKTLKEVGIQEGSTVNVEILNKVPITVNTIMDGKTIKLMVDTGRDRLVDIRKQLEKDSGVKADNQRLFLIDGDELVDESVAAAQAENNNNGMSAILGMGEKKSTKVTTGVYLKNFGIEEGSELTMEPRFVQIVVETISGKSHKLKVTLDSNMSDLIKAIAEKETAGKAGKSAGHVLKFHGKELQSGQTVKEMGLKDGTRVKLELNK